MSLDKEEIEFRDREDIPGNSPFLIEELEEKIKSDERYYTLWKRFTRYVVRGHSIGGLRLLREMDYRLGHGQNNLFVEIHGPPGVGKTMVAITLYKEFQKLLVGRDKIVHFALTLNYSQTTPAILKYPYSKTERVICIQDEEEELSGEDIERERRAFRNLIKQGRKLGFVLIKCNTDRDEHIKSKVSFAMRVWGQLPGWLLCMIENRYGYPLDFVKIRYPDKASRDWYEGIKDASMNRLQESQGKFGVDFNVDEDNQKVEKVYKATLHKYPNQVLDRANFEQLAKALFGKLGESTWRRIKKLAWNKYIGSEQKKKAEGVHKKTDASFKSGKNAMLSETYDKAKEWEKVFSETLAKTEFDSYVIKGGNGEPDGIGEKDGVTVVVALENNIQDQHHWTIHHRRLSAEREYARMLLSKGVKTVCRLYWRNSTMNLLHIEDLNPAELTKSVTFWDRDCKSYQ